MRINHLISSWREKSMLAPRLYSRLAENPGSCFDGAIIAKVPASILQSLSHNRLARVRWYSRGRSQIQQACRAAES